MPSPLHHDKSQTTESRSSRRERLRISNACHPCRIRKVKCNGSRPTCSRNQERGNGHSSAHRPVTSGHPSHEFMSDQLPSPHNHTLPKPSPGSSRDHSLLVTPTTAARKSLLTTEPLTGLDDLSEVQDSDPSHSYMAHGRFASKIASAIDDRAGSTSTVASKLVPFVDAPLFGETDLDSARTQFDTTALPPRAYADRLVGIYWQYVDPVEPVLDRARFFHDYEASYSNTRISFHGEIHVWLSILNAVFAMAVQRQESTPLQKRDEEARHYFQRSWSLLSFETVIWTPGSVELVQSLMLLNRYLHCTNNQQKTWMIAGLAMRMVQNMCFNLPDEPYSDRVLKQRVWASCVGLDRCVSWSLGRTSALNLAPSPHEVDFLKQGSSHLMWALDLHEIGNHIQLAQAQTRNPLSAKLGLPGLCQPGQYNAYAVHLDTCLNNWEKRLSSDWILENIQSVERTSRAERYLLHIRLLYYRIFLYRPMLARFCSTASHATTSTTTPKTLNLGDRLLKESAALCIEAAQKIASLVVETIEPYESMGILPWWYRIYYLHIAGTTFLAAMFQPDLYTESVSESWRSVMSALRAHEHLTTYISQCIETFETLSTKILGTRHHNQNTQSGSLAEEVTTDFCFDELFHDLGFDYDGLLFGMDSTVNEQL